MHPVIEAAGRDGTLPEWSRISEARRAHVERVAALLDDWAGALGLSGAERTRWIAAGRLHDALKDATTPDLQALVADERWPEPLLHAPAVAARLASEGVDDEEFLLALRYHSIGHPDFAALGEHLYLADYLEPGRSDTDERVALRDGMPKERADVLPVVIRRRIEAQLANGDVVMPAAIDFWNRVATEDPR